MHEEGGGGGGATIAKLKWLINLFEGKKTRRLKDLPERELYFHKCEIQKCGFMLG